MSPDASHESPSRAPARTVFDRDALKRAAGVAGALVCLVALALLIRRGLALGDALGDALARTPVAALLAALALYLVGGLLLAGAWVGLVRLAAGRRLPALPLAVGHLRAQLAKYLPGNVFHLAWRHVAARRAGADHRALALALLLETVLVSAGAALLALGVVADPRLDGIAPWARHVVWLAPGVALLAWIAAGWIGHRTGAPQLALQRSGVSLLAVLALYVGMFVCSALALRSLSPSPDALPFGAWCGWLSLAWLVGYVTPGAPAGIGLREAVLSLGLAPVLGVAEALALALLYRLVTTVADGVLAAIGFLDRSAS